MSDKYEQDPDETAKVLRSARAREAQLWGNKVASADVTPGMVVHRDDGRCICDACDGTRLSRPLPVSLKTVVLVNRHKSHRLLALDKLEQPVLEERGPTPRKPVRMNRPRNGWPAPSGRYGSKLWG